MMLSKNQLKQQIWHSKRGMLELDLLLEPFARQKLPYLSCKQQQAYVTLLKREDPELFAWLINQTFPADQQLKEIVELIKKSP